MAVSTNKGLVNGPVHNLLMQFFTPGSSKIEVFELCFYDIVTTQNHLAEVVRSKPGRRIYGENATYPPILAFLGLFAYPTPRG